MHYLILGLASESQNNANVNANNVNNNVKKEGEWGSLKCTARWQFRFWGKCNNFPPTSLETRLSM